VSQKGTFVRTWEAPGAQTGAPGAPGGQATVFEHILGWIATPGAGGRGGGGLEVIPLIPPETTVKAPGPGPLKKKARFGERLLGSLV